MNFLLFLCLSPFFALCSIPDDQMEDMYKAFFSTEFGYTLIGAKPASFDDEQYSYLSLHPKSLRKFLVSLQHTFQDSYNFILKTEYQENTEGLPSDYYIELINKKALQEMISHSWMVQAFIRAEFGTQDLFFQALEDPSLRLYEIVPYPDILGIMLGYGETNATYFLQKCRIDAYFKKDHLQPFIDIYKEEKKFDSSNSAPYALPFIKTQTKFISLEKEYRWIKKLEWDLEKDPDSGPPYMVQLPFYICRHGGDSEKVRKHYKNARRSLVQLFCEPSLRSAITRKSKRSNV